MSIFIWSTWKYRCDTIWALKPFRASLILFNILRNFSYYKRGHSTVNCMRTLCKQTVTIQNALVILHHSYGWPGTPSQVSLGFLQPLAKPHSQCLSYSQGFQFVCVAKKFRKMHACSKNELYEIKYNRVYLCICSHKYLTIYACLSDFTVHVT